MLSFIDHIKETLPLNKNQGKRIMAKFDDMQSALKSEPFPARFSHVYCSQCGQEFGPGEHGFSHCQTHIDISRAKEKARLSA